MSQKTVKFTQQGIDELPNDKPVVYKIMTSHGENIYTGTAKKGRVQDRLLEHLPSAKDPIPGKKVIIEQMSTIQEAEKKEARIITRSKPKYNE